MQLAPPTAVRPTPPDLATALRGAREELGHRPAITVLGRDRRDEQGVASLAQWAAKGAHLLELELLLEPGDVLTLDAPTGWTAAAVALAAWWSGVIVQLDPRAASPVAVVEEGRSPPEGTEDVLWLGAAVDGAPLGDVPGEAWVHAVQSFPDQPPTPRAGAELLAVLAGTERWTQAELIAATAGLPPAGTLGLDDRSTLPPALALAAVAVRPLLVGRPTVVLRDADRDAAVGERVAVWA
jgi:uncharacterized protein (TIGR03089 family)